MLWVRLLLVWMKFWGFRRKLPLLEVSAINYRVLPSDIDFNKHMNNSRFFMAMDIGRVDWLLKTGVLQMALKQRWAPVIASSEIRYYKSLKLFQKYTLTTRLVSWDEKWFYMRHQFEKGTSLVASCDVKALFRGSSGNVKTKDLLQLVGYDEKKTATRSDSSSPELPFMNGSRKSEF